MGEDCVEWFVNELLEIEKYLKHHFENYIAVKPNTIPKNCGRSSTNVHSPNKKIVVGFVEKNLKLWRKKKQVIQDHCQFTNKFRGLAHDKRNFNSRKKRVSFVPDIFAIIFLDTVVI